VQQGAKRAPQTRQLDRAFLLGELLKREAQLVYPRAELDFGDEQALPGHARLPT
jgi:hypothetical protein